MKKLLFIPALVSCILIAGCVSMAPVSNSFESAKTLDKGQIDVMGNYSFAFISGKDETGARQTDHTNNNIGFRVGYGIIDRFDLKLRYERLMPVMAEDKNVLNGVNFFGLTPRYALVKNKLTAGLGLGLYTYRIKETQTTDAQSSSNFALSPGLAFTFPSDKNFDVTIGTKIDIFTNGGSNLWHLNLGFGISSNASKWSLRPELGLIKDLENFSDYSWFSGGMAFILKFNSAKE
jgi:hypothetical protein